MAQNEVVMPQMGESITTGTITKWNKAVGDNIEIDEILLEISTDKVESEIPSPFAGRVDKIYFEEGETVDVGKTIAVIEDDLSKPIESSNAPKEKTEVQAPKEEIQDLQKTVQQEQEVSSASSTAKSSDRPSHGRFYTPLVKKMADEAGVPLSSLESIDGSGAGGRVNRSDLEKFLKGEVSSQTRISESKPAPSPARPASVPTPPIFSGSERTVVIPMDNMRKAIAKNMVQSKLTSPHVNSISEVDMSHIVKFREGFKDEFFKQEGFKITYTPFIMYAMIMALKEHPFVNASIEGDNIVVKKDINLGCAVAVPGNGLVVPVIKQADSLNLTGLCRTLNDLANRARSKKLSLDELQGGTFTFTNVGSFGTLLATPVILQPQVGIMAAGVIEKKPVVTKDDAIAIRSMMYLTHTYDHRLVDGQLGGQFLASVIRNLNEMNPRELF